MGYLFSKVCDGVIEFGVEGWWFEAIGLQSF